jgi:Domain of unknown function (DUF6471)
MRATALMLSVREWADRARRFLKAEMKRADATYAELAKRLKAHGLVD